MFPAFRVGEDYPPDYFRTLLTVYRFSTVGSADHVVVLDEGEVVATGTHEELLETSEYYRRLASTIAEPAPT